MKADAKVNRISGVVTDAGSKGTIAGARVTISTKAGATLLELLSGEDGRYTAEGMVDGRYHVEAEAFEEDASPLDVEVKDGVGAQADLSIPVAALVSFKTEEAGTLTDVTTTAEGTLITLSVSPGDTKRFNYAWNVSRGHLEEKGAEAMVPEVHWNTTGLLAGAHTAEVTISEKSSASLTVSGSLVVTASTTAGPDATPIVMRRSATTPTPDLPLWLLIRRSGENVGFDNYLNFMSLVLCGSDEFEEPPANRTAVRDTFQRLRTIRALPYNDADAFRLLKVATEAFLMVNCGVAYPVLLPGRRGMSLGLETVPFSTEDLGEVVRRVGLDPSAVNLDDLWREYLQPLVNGDRDSTLPYLKMVRDKLGDVRLKNSFFAAEDPSIDLPNAERCFGILRKKLNNPCLIELIWAYWMEQGMLVQTMNAISMRFQNIRGQHVPDPLAMLEIDPLRPLNNMLWGYIQDEQHRLSLVRRAYEYDHHYGLSIHGKAVPPLRTADSRSQFLEAFHHLLSLCAIFFKEDDDTTVIADGFPVLNALKDVHYLLAEGAHNQFGDLPSTARQEMLIQQWILARPEFREFLPTRTMVAYPEPWMDRVDAMKRLQGWTETSIREFAELAEFGEQLLLSIRYGAWGEVNDATQASNWARFWRAEIQGYTHSYRHVTGVDLTTEPADTEAASLRTAQPGVLIQRRAAMLPPARRALGPADLRAGARAALRRRTS